MKTAALSFIEAKKFARKTHYTKNGNALRKHPHSVHDTIETRLSALTPTPALPIERELESGNPKPEQTKTQLVSGDSLWRRIQVFRIKLFTAIPDTSQRNTDRLIKKQIADVAKTAVTSFANVTRQQGKAVANDEQERIARYKAAGL